MMMMSERERSGERRWQNALEREPSAGAGSRGAETQWRTGITEIGLSDERLFCRSHVMLPKVKTSRH